MANPFSSQYWLDEEALLYEAVSALLLAAYLEGVEGGIATLPIELQPLVNYDLVNTNALRFANEYRYEWIRGITETTMRQVQEAMSNWIQGGEALSVLEDVLAPIFGRVRAEMIASTEITRIFALANAETWESTGFVRQARWNTANDSRVCPICGPRNGLHLDPADTDALPPAHIRCRCWLTPVVDVEAVLEQIEQILV